MVTNIMDGLMDEFMDAGPMNGRGCSSGSLILYVHSHGLIMKLLLGRLSMSQPLSVSMMNFHNGNRTGARRCCVCWLRLWWRFVLVSSSLRCAAAYGWANGQGLAQCVNCKLPNHPDDTIELATDGMQFVIRKIPGDLGNDLLQVGVDLDLGHGEVPPVVWWVR